MLGKGEKKKILIVEDDAFLVNAYKLRFGEENVDMEIATNHQEALLVLQKNPMNAIILDVRLPGGSGFDFLEVKQTHAMWKNVPVVVVSNLSQDKDIERGMKLGAVEYIVKADCRLCDVTKKVMSHLA
ncbi:MAG: response regulator [Candidatus Paceibacterota bacterium]|jgi:DNA-binding response OmpR family regulator